MDGVKYSADKPIKVEWGPAEQGSIGAEGGREGVRLERTS
jgi:hypothetical protein